MWRAIGTGQLDVGLNPDYDACTVFLNLSESQVLPQINMDEKTTQRVGKENKRTFIKVLST